MEVVIQDGDQALLLLKTKNARNKSVSSLHGRSQINVYLLEIQTAQTVHGSRLITNTIMEEVQ